MLRRLRHRRGSPSVPRWLPGFLLGLLCLATVSGAALDRETLEGLPTMTVDGVVCTLSDALRAANLGTTVGGCTGSAGLDILSLEADVVLTAADTAHSSLLGGAYAGLPDITSDVVLVAGAGQVIERDAGLSCEPEEPTAFRLFNILADGALFLFDLTLRGGCVAPAAGTPAEGGAIHLDQGRLELTGTTLENHRVVGVASGAAGAVGGALFCSGGEIPSIQGATFRNNEARGVDGQATGTSARGGAGYFDQCTVGTLDTNLFQANVAVGSSSPGGTAQGGALHIAASTVEAMLGCTWIGNQALGGDSSDSSGGAARGGALSLDGTTASIGELGRSRFESNLARGGDGGGADNPGDATGGALDIDTPSGGLGQLFNSYFLDNESRSGGTAGVGGSTTAAGGAVALRRGLIEGIERTTFFENRALAVAASDAQGRGGALLVGSTIQALRLNTFKGNRAIGGTDNDPGDLGGTASGGGILVRGSGRVETLHANTFVKNKVQAGFGAGGSGEGLGGALFADGPFDAVAGNLFSANFAVTSDGVESFTDCHDVASHLVSGGWNFVEVPGTCTFAGPGDQVDGLTATYFPADLGCAVTLPDGSCVPTVAIDQDSPATDQGSCTALALAEDARQVPRPFDLPALANADDGCDIGAFEAVDVDGDGFTEAADCAPDDPSANQVDNCGVCGGDDSTCRLFADGFESGDTVAWQ